MNYTIEVLDKPLTAIDTYDTELIYQWRHAAGKSWQDLFKAVRRSFGIRRDDFKLWSGQVEVKHYAKGLQFVRQWWAMEYDGNAPDSEAIKSVVSALILFDDMPFEQIKSRLTFYVPQGTSVPKPFQPFKGRVFYVDYLIRRLPHVPLQADETD